MSSEDVHTPPPQDVEKEAAETERKVERDSMDEKAGVDTGFAKRARHSISGQGAIDAVQEGQIFSMTDIDPALDAKMRLVNQVGAIHNPWRLDIGSKAPRPSMKSDSLACMPNCSSSMGSATSPIL